LTEQAGGFGEALLFFKPSAIASESGQSQFVWDINMGLTSGA
jgi:hypothetical protein